MRQKKSRQRIQAKKVSVLQPKKRPVQAKKIAASKKRRLRGPRAGLMLAAPPPQFSFATQEHICDTNTVQSTLHEEIYLEIPDDVVAVLAVVEEGQGGIEQEDIEEDIEEDIGEELESATEEQTVTHDTSPSIAIIDITNFIKEDIDDTLDHVNTEDLAQPEFDMHLVEGEPGEENKGIEIYDTTVEDTSPGANDSSTAITQESEEDKPQDANEIDASQAATEIIESVKDIETPPAVEIAEIDHIAQEEEATGTDGPVVADEPIERADEVDVPQQLNAIEPDTVEPIIEPVQAIETVTLLEVFTDNAASEATKDSVAITEPDATEFIREAEASIVLDIPEVSAESEAQTASEVIETIEQGVVSKAPEEAEESDAEPKQPALPDSIAADIEPVEADDWDTTTEKMTSVRLQQLTAVISTSSPSVHEGETPEQPDDASTEVALKTLPVTPAIEALPVTPTVRKTRLRSLSNAFTYSLLGLVASLLFMVWHDVSIPHLYATTLDARSGAVLAKQDLSTFQDGFTLTAPVSAQGSVLVGMQSRDPQSKSQVALLEGGPASWQVQKTLTATLPPGSLSVAPGGDLLIENASGLQVFSPAGDLLWQLPDAQPAQGAHPFQPVSDGQTVYTLSTVQSFQVGAYDLKTGKERWTRKLDDTVNYAPPLILDATTLYVAGDHNLYALDTNQGALHWQKTFAARTLLLEQEDQTHLLVAAGAHGLIGLDPATGSNAWTFRSQPGSTITPAQFYQATLGKPASSAHQIVYTTGVVWQLPQVLQHIWLYAVDASSGSLLWSQPIASSIVSTDAGRFFAPALDAMHNIVALQQQVDGSTQTILGFDATTGGKRWSQLNKGLSSSAPSLFVAPNGSLLLLSSTIDISTLLLTPTIARLVLLLLAAFSAVCLLLLNLLLLPSRLRALRHVAQTLTRRIRMLLRRVQHQKHLLLKLIAAPLIAGIVVAGVLVYFWLSAPQERLYKVASTSGTTQWQRTVNAATEVLRVDEQGSIVAVNAGTDEHQLQAINPDGSVRWHMFNTEGTFFLPDVPSQTGTLLVALSGHSLFSYQLAPDDPAYPRALDHLLALYLLDRNTGTPIWQHIVFYPDEQQDASILGSDTHYIYIASRQANLQSGNTGPAVQLLGVNQETGTIDWRVFGPVLSPTTSPDYGKLFLQGNQAIWQVASTVYAIDTTVGQIAWRRPLPEDATSILAQEESNMVQVGSLLLIARSNAVHALDSASGNEVWTIASNSPDNTNNSQTPTIINVADQTILISKQAQLYAFDPTSRRLLWDQRLSGPVQQVRTSDDGKMLYAMIAASNQKSSPALIALNTQTGAIRWKFTQSEQFSFANAASDGYQYRAERLFISTCRPSQNACNQQQFTLLDATTGKTLWSFSGNDLGAIRISPDGKTIFFRITRNMWSDIIARL